MDSLFQKGLGTALASASYRRFVFLAAPVLRAAFAFFVFFFGPDFGFDGARVVSAFEASTSGRSYAS
jgi:hypothetical protein